jgi:hypothetical protein
MGCDLVSGFVLENHSPCQVMCGSEANATSGSGNNCYAARIERRVFGRIIAGVDRGIQLGRLRSIRNEGANWRQLSRNGFGGHFAATRGGWSIRDKGGNVVRIKFWGFAQDLLERHLYRVSYQRVAQLGTFVETFVDTWTSLFLPNCIRNRAFWPVLRHACTPSSRRPMPAAINQSNGASIARGYLTYSKSLLVNQNGWFL